MNDMTSAKYILLIEDDANDRELTIHSLRSHKIRNNIIPMRDGVEALDFLFSTGERKGLPLPELPQFIILDLKLPRLSGIDVLQALRGNERTKLLPVIIFTSSQEEQDIITSYRLGANSYVRKPIDAVTFAESVQNLSLYWMILNEYA
jgi:two-component system, response regulator